MIEKFHFSQVSFNQTHKSENPAGSIEELRSSPLSCLMTFEILLLRSDELGKLKNPAEFDEKS